MLSFGLLHKDDTDPQRLWLINNKIDVCKQCMMLAGFFMSACTHIHSPGKQDTQTFTMDTADPLFTYPTQLEMDNGVILTRLSGS